MSKYVILWELRGETVVEAEDADEACEIFNFEVDIDEAIRETRNGGESPEIKMVTPIEKAPWISRNVEK